ncbi:MAG: hypothetical protein GTN74_06580 [Proteobacteria bacterium]|nr:hypothetical protein [Pseudomonadota bacterium]
MKWIIARRGLGVKPRGIAITTLLFVPTKNRFVINLSEFYPLVDSQSLVAEGFPRQMNWLPAVLLRVDTEIFMDNQR